jgi:hypothetical protein
MVIGHINVLLALGNDTYGRHVEEGKPGYRLATAAKNKPWPFGSGYALLYSITLNKWHERISH